MVAFEVLSVDDSNCGSLVSSKVRAFPSPSVNVSSIVRLVNVTLPVFVIVMVYSIRSFPPMRLSELLSVVTAVFTTSIDGLELIISSVTSSPVSPAPVSPSSEMSVTTVPAGLVPLKVAVLSIPPASIAA